jgi:hypothetical protein
VAVIGCGQQQQFKFFGAVPPRRRAQFHFSFLLHPCPLSSAPPSLALSAASPKNGCHFLPRTHGAVSSGRRGLRIARAVLRIAVHCDRKLLALVLLITVWLLPECVFEMR